MINPLTIEVQFLLPLWLVVWPLSMGLVVFLYWRGHLNPDAVAATIPGATSHRYFHPQAQLLHAISREQQSLRSQRRHLWLLLGIILVISGLHIALAQPYRYGQKIPQPPLYRDVVFIVDTSVTMVLRDYFVDGEQVNRLTMLQSVLQHFTEQLSDNRMGIVVYSEQAHTLVPLTADTQLINTMLRRLEITLTGRISNVSKGILYTLGQLQSKAQPRTDARSDDTRAKPVMILVTDVNRPVRDIDPRAAAAYVAEAGYQLHTVAIGAASEDAIEQDAASLIYEPANIQLLEEIAGNGNGQFFHAQNTASLREAITTIQSAALRETQAEPRYVPIALYHWPLGAALIGLVLVQLILIGRRR